MEENITPRNTKDNIYKKVFGAPEIFAEFLNDFIPIDILKGLKPQDIRDITPRHLPLFLDNKDSDTVKEINLGNDADPLYVIGIVEHESHINYMSSYKMLLYTVLVWDTYIKNNDKLCKEEIKQHGSTKRKLSTDKDFKLPPVLPIVFYDGASEWTSSMNLIERIHMGDIFEKYIPKFEYELVDLNEYSREDLIKYGNALSLILLIDKARQADDINFSVVVPENYLEKLSQNIPESLLPLISDCVRVFLKHIEAPEEEIERIADKIYQRRLNEMFQMVDGYSVKKLKNEMNEKHRTEKLEAAEKLLKFGVLIDHVAESMKLTPKEIEFLKEKIKK